MPQKVHRPTQGSFWEFMNYYISLMGWYCFHFHLENKILIEGRETHLWIYFNIRIFILVGKRLERMEVPSLEVFEPYFG